MKDWPVAPQNREDASSKGDSVDPSRFERHSEKGPERNASNSRSEHEAFSDRLLPSLTPQALVDFPLQRANQAAKDITNFALENDVFPYSFHQGLKSVKDASPAYALLLQSVMLGIKREGPISPDKHVQLEQLRSLKSKKLFQYSGVSERKPTVSPFALTPLGDDEDDSHLPRRAPRKIPKAPFKVLDAPALQDDFYLNLVDWSSSNMLAVGLGSSVYLWSASTSKVTRLCDLAQTDNVCSVAFSQRSTYLSVGTHQGDVQIWDLQTLKRVHSLPGHNMRVGTMSWSTTHLSTGSRDREVLHHDIRTETAVHKFQGHNSEVCGLKWSPDDRQLASGGNDNQLCIWELRAKSNPVISFNEHTAAVKAIAWSPHQHGLLASGGGTADRHIRFWSTTTSNALNSVDTGSQVCNLSWSKNVNEIVSTHGYSQNQIVVWKYPEMTKLSTLTGHTYRVLYLAVSPDGQTIVTGAGDETLRFWSVFPPQNSQDNARGYNTSLIHTTVR